MDKSILLMVLVLFNQNSLNFEKFLLYFIHEVNVIAIFFSLKSFLLSTIANRGNVAIVAWNTLNARVWGVSETKGDEVTKGQVTDTLLATHFRNFVYEDEDDDKWFKQAEELEVVAVPSTDAEIGDRQIVLDKVPVELQGAFEKAPKKDEDEATYRTLDDEDNFDKVYAYVPEDVYEDLDELLGREITVMFGKDNVVALIIVTNDEVVNNVYATRFDGEELTIGGEKYKFDVLNNNTYKLYVNNVLRDAEATLGDLTTELTTILGAAPSTTKDFTKNIKANVILTSKGRIDRLDLYVSGNFANYKTNEFVVGKVKSEKIYGYKGTELIYNYKDVDEEDLPRVYLDGKKASIEDIEVGDVLTVYYDEVARTNVSVINATRKTVEGTVSRVKNATTVTVDSESYLASAVEPLLTEDELKDAATKDSLVDYADEKVTLYLNMYDEYVLVATDEVATDYQFAILDYVYEVKEDEEDEDVYTQKLRLFMPDGSKSREYVVTYDKNDFDGTDDDEELGYVAEPDETLIPDEWVKGALIAFAANANKEIETTDIINVTLKDVINEGAGDDEVEYDGVEGFEIIVGTKADGENKAVANYDDKRIEIAGKTYRFKSSGIIMNANEGNPEIATWKKLVSEADNALSAADISLVCKEDETTIQYIFIDSEASADSAARYAVVLETGYTGKVNGKTEVLAKLYTEDGEESEYILNGKDADEDTVVSFELSGDKLKADPTLLVDITALNDLELDEAMTNAIMTGKAIAGVTGSAAVIERACTHCNSANATPGTCQGTITAGVCSYGCTLTNPTAWVHATGCTAGAGTACATATCAEGTPCTPVVTAATHGTCPDHTDADTGYRAAADAVTEIAAATKESYRVDEVDGKYLVYVDIDDTKHVADVKVDLDEVIVIDIREDVPTIIDFEDIEAGDLVAGFGGSTEDGVDLLVVFAD